MAKGYIVSYCVLYQIFSRFWEIDLKKNRSKLLAQLTTSPFPTSASLMPYDPLLTTSADSLAMKKKSPLECSVLADSPYETGCCAAKKVLLRSGACFGAQQNNFWCAPKCLVVRTSVESCLLQSFEFWSDLLSVASTGSQSCKH
ncbi:MAG: hypothetical protein J6W80_05920, partial [Kiritimatiellae bacterium]|nr:hypothetical protein [Kiritimatiellia bacterium]